MKKSRSDQSQPANLYIRWEKIPDSVFLWWVDGRDTPQFSAKFANWLALVCRVQLVRAYVDDPVDAFSAGRRAELYPARFQAAVRQLSPASLLALPHLLI